VFTRGYRLWMTHANGSDTSPLTADDGSHRFADADWSPDGTRLAAVEWHSDATGKAIGRISIVDLEGNARPVTPYVAEHARPDWSPDGTRIVYIKARERVGWSVPETDLWVVNADGSGNRQLTAINGRTAQWLPDGRILGACAGGGGLCSVDPDNESDVRGIPHSSDVFAFALSPDGRRLVVESRQQQGPADWYVGTMRIDGTERTRLLDRWYTLGIDWSPDGRTLVFSGLPDSEPPSHTCLTTGSLNDDCPDPPPVRIWRMGGDGSDLRPITHGPGDYEPSWRPSR
jgi:Tol biopolymer transport system component